MERSAFDAEFKRRFSPAEFASAREPHASGGFHLHVFVGFAKRVDVRSSRHFDLALDGQVYHPNVQRCRSRVDWLGYIAKGDDHGVAELRGDLGFDPLSAPLGKRKTQYLDWRWSQDFAASRALKAPEYPIKLECAERTHEMHAPDPAIKRRSWWIVAPPNAGKTRWLNRVFNGVQIYCPRTGNYPFEGYMDQDIIVYDDRTGVSFEEFSSVLNTWNIPQPIAGQIRYTTQNWKRGHTRNVIVLSNKTIEESMPEDDVQRMRKRFIQIIDPVLKCPADADSDDEAPLPPVRMDVDDFVS